MKSGLYAHFLFVSEKRNMQTQVDIQHLIVPAIEALGFELVSCQFVYEAGRRTLQVFIDAPQGVNVEACSQVSRQINAILDAESTISGAYDLEVSSPGLDRPLITLAHYQRFIGSLIKLKLRQPMEGRRNFTGQLTSVTEQEITLTVKDSAIVIALDQIEKANLVPDVRF